MGSKITDIIKGAAEREGLTAVELGKTIGMPISTLKYRFSNPGTWRLYEIGSLLRHVNFFDEELKEIRGNL